MLLVDDDERILEALRRDFQSKRISVLATSHANDAVALARRYRPNLVVVDLRLGAGWGLDLLPVLKSALPDAALVLLSAYMSVGIATDAVNAGARTALLKPSNAEQILSQLDAPSQARAAVPMRTLAQVEFEYIMHTLAACRGNASQAAKILGIHRNTLQQRLKSAKPKQ